MPQSMTGFGTGEHECSGFLARVDIKAVNHRYFEANARIPSEMMALEVRLLSLVRERLQRGKVYCVVNIRRTGEGASAIDVNWNLVDELFRVLDEMHGRCTLAAAPVNLENLLRIDGVLNGTNVSDIMEDAWRAIEKAALSALDSLEGMREVEGAAMADDVSKNLALFREQVDSIGSRRESVPKEARQRIEKRLSELAPEIPVAPDRIAAEIAIMADRSDISEEISRLGAHLDSFVKIIQKKGEPCGKKMDFICQELLREINTIGSKSQDSAITALVVIAKSHLERVREQVQNIL